MRTQVALVLIGLSVGLGGSLPAKADVSFSAGLEINAPSDFYAPLGSYGAWVNIGTYGRCWHPSEVAPDWRPYSTGYWEWTDAGWYWVSDEPWAWACYHYGSWVDDPADGWCWIPGTEWAPSWVVWRYGPDYIGWAPCGPGGLVPAASLFAFVDAHKFHDHFRPRDFVSGDARIINRTHVINNIRSENITIAGSTRRVMVNRGPGVDTIEKDAHVKFTSRPVADVIRQTPAPRDVGHKPSLLGTERPSQPAQQPHEQTSRAEPRVYPQQPAAQPQNGERHSPAAPAPHGHPETPSPTGRSQEQFHPQPEPQPHLEPQPPHQEYSQPKRAPLTPPRESSPERSLPPAGNPGPSERMRPEAPPRGFHEAPPQNPSPGPGQHEDGRDQNQH